MMPFDKPSATTQAAVADMLILLTDALDAGLCLLVDGPQSGIDREQVLSMLRGFAEEASHLFASSAIEPSGALFELAAQARTSGELRHMQRLSQQLHDFLQQSAANRARTKRAH